MKRFLTTLLLAGIPCFGLWLGLTVTPAGAASAPGADDEQAVLLADHALVAALGRADAKAASEMLDSEFLWTDLAGDSRDRAKVLASLPGAPLGDERGAQATLHMYGQVGAVQVTSGKLHILRIWGKRPAGWRLVVYHEVRQRDAPSSAAPAPTTNDCENPCKSVPYAPRNAAERDILKSWGELETAVTNHDPGGWAPHFLDEFVVISSGGTESVDKAGRMKALSRPGIGPAPARLAADPAVRFLHFADTVIMIGQANPYAGKPAHVTRIWAKRDGTWRMAVSYQTQIQSAEPIAPPKL